MNVTTILTFAGFYILIFHTKCFRRKAFKDHSSKKDSRIAVVDIAITSIVFYLIAGYLSTTITLAFTKVTGPIAIHIHIRGTHNPIWLTNNRT
jgi:uncharacterized membrane protein SpoIIM required for sporulation